MDKRIYYSKKGNAYQIGIIKTPESAGRKTNGSWRSFADAQDERLSGGDKKRRQPLQVASSV